MTHGRLTATSVPDSAANVQRVLICDPLCSPGTHRQNLSCLDREKSKMLRPPSLNTLAKGISGPRFATDLQASPCPGPLAQCSLSSSDEQKFDTYIATLVQQLAGCFLEPRCYDCLWHSASCLALSSCNGNEGSGHRRFMPDFYLCLFSTLCSGLIIRCIFVI